MQTKASIIDKMLHRYSLSSLTPVISPTEDHFFYCENNKKQSYVGACFLATPLNGMDDQGFNLFVSAISVKLPPNSIIQIQQAATNHVDDQIDSYYENNYNSIKNNHGLNAKQKENLHSIVLKRTESLRQAKITPPVPANGITLRQSRIIVSVKIPADLQLSEYDLQRCKELILTVYDSLRSTTLPDLKQLTVNEYLSELRSIVYPFEPLDNTYDEFQKISEQVFRKTTETDNRDPNITKIGDTHISVLSVSALPKKNDISLTNMLVGDPMGSTKQVGCPYFINCTIIIPETQDENTKIDFDYAQTFDTATPWAKKFAPKLVDRLEGLELLRNATKRGEIPCRLYFNVVLFSKDKQKLPRIATVLQSYYKSLGLILVPDSKIVLPLFWNTLPLYASIESLKNTSRTLRMTTVHAATFAPLFADFQNLRGNFSQIYYTRRGNIFGFDPMAGQNHNGMIFGSSGGGKSVFGQNFLLQEYESGALIRVLDDGQSYKKLCYTVGGSFIEFTDSSDVCLNPFTLVENINEELDQLARIVKQMASPTTPLDDFCMSKIKQAIKSVYSTSAKKTTISDIADFLSIQPEEEIRRLGSQLFEYTVDGSYGKYFNGDNNLNLNAQMVVLELEGLKSDPLLKTVVMMMVCTRIQADMYRNFSYARKFVLFEEVTSYFEDPLVGAFIADFYERVRKYRGGCWLVTQNAERIADSPAIGKVMINANYMIYLPYVAEQIDVMAQKKLLKDDPYIINTYKSLRLSKGVYSEAMIFETSTENISVIRTILNDFEKILFSSSDEYFRPFIERIDKGEDIAEIIDSYLLKAEKDKYANKANSNQDINDLKARIENGEDLDQVLLDFKNKIMRVVG
ncbi:TraG/VirB4 family ATPase [Acinetobacter baumannii]|uniref:TraC family protein n=1 Tax=Acinetobacter baumannii TaxID=470 RepID=UPI002581E757|nr:TraC family protein [Acinetobacter baumannii]EKU3442128.1 TraC family protein [Acinetobacter baumannii]MDP7849615.1 TraC family protein [Acinetobacter baumannii]